MTDTQSSDAYRSVGNTRTQGESIVCRHSVGEVIALRNELVPLGRRSPPLLIALPPTVPAIKLDVQSPTLAVKVRQKHNKNGLTCRPKGKKELGRHLFTLQRSRSVQTQWSGFNCHRQERCSLLFCLALNGLRTAFHVVDNWGQEQLG